MGTRGVPAVGAHCDGPMRKTTGGPVGGTPGKHLSGPKEVGSLGSKNVRILVDFDPTCEGHPEEGSPMEIDTCHNFGILGIGVQKNSQIHVFHGLINFAGICVKN